MPHLPYPNPRPEWALNPAFLPPASRLLPSPHVDNASPLLKALCWARSSCWTLHMAPKSPCSSFWGSSELQKVFISVSWRHVTKYNEPALPNPPECTEHFPCTRPGAESLFGLSHSIFKFALGGKYYSWPHVGKLRFRDVTEPVFELRTVWLQNPGFYLKYSTSLSTLGFLPKGRNEEGWSNSRLWERAGGIGPVLLSTGLLIKTPLWLKLSESQKNPQNEVCKETFFSREQNRTLDLNMNV